MTPNFCGNCGARVIDTPNFCAECGQKLSQDSPNSQNNESLKIQQELLEIERKRQEDERNEQIGVGIVGVIIAGILFWIFFL